VPINARRRPPEKKKETFTFAPETRDAEENKKNQKDHVWNNGGEGKKTEARGGRDP